MIDWPDSLVSALARKRAILVIGSGVSKHSIGDGGKRPPTWSDFLREAARDCPDKNNISPVLSAIEAGDYLHACEWLKKRFDEAWVPYLRRIFSRPAFPPTDIHAEILKLNSRIVFSLNFDDLYERYVNGIHNGSYIIKNYYDPAVAEFLRGDGHYIIKVHGNLNSAEELIFTQKDYSKARVKHASFYQAFDAALLTHTFLFIGSGYSDPDVNLLLENQNFGFPSQSPHYLLSGSDYGDDRKLSLRENRNIKVLEYDPIDEFHTGLTSEIQKLNELVETERFIIAKSASW